MKTTEQIELATATFWGTVSAAFPEMQHGDSQLSDEVETAIAVWCNGTDDELSGAAGMPVLRPSKRRIDAALKAAVDSASSALFQPSEAIPAPAAVVAELKGAMTHILYWNFPGAAR